MSIKGEVMTVWHHLMEDDGGRALYRVQTVAAYTAKDRTSAHASSGNGIYGAGMFTHRDKITGFLLPERTADDEMPFFLVPTRDFLAYGDQTGFSAPAEAADAGICIYGVTSSVQPPRISDGTLVNWCCFEAEREETV